MSKELKKELKALLKKYNATIAFNCSDCSDTYGISDARLEVTIRPDPKRFKEDVVIKCSGWSMDHTDI